MSLILDALARAERDKRREAQPLSSMLADAEVTDGKRAPPGRRLVGAVAGVVLLLAALTVVAWLGRHEPAATSMVAEELSAVSAGTGTTPARGPGFRPAREAVEADSESVARRPAPAPSDIESRAAPAVRTSTGRPVPVTPATEIAFRAVRPVANEAEVASLYASASAEADGQAVSAGDASAGAEPVAQAESATSRQAVQAESEPASPGRVARSAGGRSEEPVDLEALLREVRTESAALGLAEHPVPLLATLSKQFRDSVPTLMYLRHDYNSGGPSTVLINGDTLRAGGRTRGVEVREILTDSVICRYDGTEFRLRALNSWVNL